MEPCESTHACDGKVRWVTWVLLLGCAVLLAPFAPVVMLALWLGAAARVLHEPLSRALGGRVRVAAGITVFALTTIVIPFVLVVVSLAADAYGLGMQLAQSPRGKAVLEQLASGNGGGDATAQASPASLWNLILSQQERALGILQQIAGTAARVLIGLFVLLAGVYAVLIEGGRWYRWFEQHAPIPSALLGRLRDAFYETGRGLFIGIGGAGLLQAIVATIAYLVLRVPHALELGLITFCFSLIPAIGTAFVWAPVAAGLALTGRTGAAIALVVCGIAVIGSVDNLVRPLLARRGRLQLPAYLVLVAMFAGVEVIGAWGLLVAPLVVRLAKAALEFDRARDHEPRVLATSSDQPTPSQAMTDGDDGRAHRDS
jgi:predicted PurR-regulated permease PerM